jgi:hypothetical protein
LIYDGYKEINDIHQTEVDASKKHLRDLQQLLKELIDNALRPVASAAQPALHAAASAIESMTRLANAHVSDVCSRGRGGRECV